MVVLDSSFLVGYYNEKDVHHEKAKIQMAGLMAGNWGSGLLLEYVFVEVATILLRKVGLGRATEVAGILLDAQEIESINCSGFFRETLDRFQNQPGTLSFTDAAIVTVALRLTQGKVLTFDQGILSYPGISLVVAPP